GRSSDSFARTTTRSPVPSAHAGIGRPAASAAATGWASPESRHDGSGAPTGVPDVVDTAGAGALALTAARGAPLPHAAVPAASSNSTVTAVPRSQLMPLMLAPAAHAPVTPRSRSGLELQPGRTRSARTGKWSLASRVRGVSTTRYPVTSHAGSTR